MSRQAFAIGIVMLHALGAATAWSQVQRTAAPSLPLQHEPEGDRWEVAQDPAARAMFWDLVQHARYGFSNMEQVAFIIRERSGGLGCVLWPESGEPDSGRWEGAFPAGVVAIAHTHPNWLPVPSRIDIRTASRTRTPVYVVTRSQIYKTAGGEPIALTTSDWKPTTPAGRMPRACRFPS